MKRMEDETHENSERWLLTYSDLITLLMVFFVIMYSMSSVNVKKYGQLASSLGSAMGGGGNLIGNGNGVSKSPGVQIVEGEEKRLETLKTNIDEYIEKNGLANDVTTQVEEKGVIVRLKNSIIFESGSAQLKDNSKNEIIEIGKLLKQMGNYIRVEGHTDSIPIHKAEFSSNWQLSAIRAANVAEMLINGSGISSDKIVAIGYGENRPIASNLTLEGRAQNRRVDIIIVSSKFEEIEKN